MTGSISQLRSFEKLSNFLLDATRIKGIYWVIGTVLEKIADQIVERTYVSRIMGYFKLLLCLSIGTLSAKLEQL